MEKPEMFSRKTLMFAFLINLIAFVVLYFTVFFPKPGNTPIIAFAFLPQWISMFPLRESSYFSNAPFITYFFMFWCAFPVSLLYSRFFWQLLHFIFFMG